MQGCVRPVLQPRQSSQFSQPAFPLLCSRNIWTPRQERKRKRGRKRNVYLTRFISFPSFLGMEKERGALSNRECPKVSVGTNGTGHALAPPGHVTAGCQLGGLLSVTQLFPRMQPGVMRPAVATLWLLRGSVGRLQGQRSALPGITSAFIVG